MNTNAPVCVTGVSGFIAAHVVRELLEREYSVKGTVRSLDNQDKYSHLTTLPGAGEGLKLVEAELLAQGSYDEAVANCEYVIHTASPYVVDVKDPQRDLVDPAVKGTLNVLQACEKSSKVKRVVLTSSMAAITDEPNNSKVFTEEDWNTLSSLKRNPYYYSKTAAERAAWNFMEERHPDFSLVVINPYMVIGPSLGPSLNTSNKVLRDMMAGVYPGILTVNWGFVDVRDVARAHVLAMEIPEANGRYLCAGESLTMREVVELLKSSGYEKYKLPRLNMAGTLGDFTMKILSYTQPKGTGSYMRSHIGRAMRFDNSKIKQEFDFEFKPARESILDAVKNLLRWGHLKERT